MGCNPRVNTIYLFHEYCYNGHMIGTPELLIIAGVVVLIFGAKRIPELFGGVGKGIKEFKKGIKEEEEENQKLQSDASQDTAQSKPSNQNESNS